MRCCFTGNSNQGFGGAVGAAGGVVGPMQDVLLWHHVMVPHQAPRERQVV